MANAALWGAVGVHTASTAAESGDRLRCGFIGIGNRGSELLDAALAQKKVDIVAVADTYNRNRDKAADRCRKKYKKASAYTRFEDLLDREKIHAVVVATPDHIHAPAILAAMDAGLDVYTEKPMTLTWREAKVVRDRARASRAVIQVGTQLRSTDIYRKAREVVQAGEIGKLVCVRVNRSYASSGLNGFKAPADASPETVHWDLFLRHTKKYPYDPVRYFRWRQFVEYSNGYIGDLMLHHMDVCHFITGCGMPRRVMSTGGKFFMEDVRTTPDTISTIIEYPEKFVFNYTTTVANAHYGQVERYIGTEGVVEIRNMKEMS
ncbi:MAG: Gfo/Idh/MocA family oxidoreductase, partial [bacterium]|nr:Gfo/Idh/MocA family oxidoreductase [bacterium]